MQLLWHKYRYYPYEKQLALREVQALLPNVKIEDAEHGVMLQGSADPEAASRLVYFAAAQKASIRRPTLQSRLEQLSGVAGARQATRYSAHGLHEYKGRFNPQIARAILNILGIRSDAVVLDPFCGSGTSLLECAHLGVRAIGTDINPLAVFLANAKLQALKTPASKLTAALHDVVEGARASRILGSDGDDRMEYLSLWFDRAVLRQMEGLRAAICASNDRYQPVLLALASNLLRDYSFQDPNDLRIRRRKTPLPSASFIDAFQAASLQFIARLQDAQKVIGKKRILSRAYHSDSRLSMTGIAAVDETKFDCAITSPPYATALPYIDTQRLSLVWLDLISPSEILSLDASLLGSREIRGKARTEAIRELLENAAALPSAQADYCRQLQQALADSDGFRRQAVPSLLYRYFVGMAEVFRSVHNRLKNGSAFALIVGGNHTVLGGRRFNIDTPNHLASLGAANGWNVEEVIPLQTYQRFGYHMANAVDNEALVILRAV